MGRQEKLEGATWLISILLGSHGLLTNAIHSATDKQTSKPLLRLYVLLDPLHCVAVGVICVMMTVRW